MTPEEIGDWLAGRTTGGIRWGLERTGELLAGVGDPHRRFHGIHIGGTNGKGSVAALCDAALRASGRPSPTGLYTSPHLVSFTERIRIDGTPVGADLLRHAAERLRPDIERTGATFFEATTAIAFLCFAEAGVEIATVEVGLGGRLDSTNVLMPRVTAVTNVARDHTEYLGDTLQAIAAEKAGIFKPGIPAATAAANPAALAVLRRMADEVGAPLRVLDDVAKLREVRSDIAGTRFRLCSDAWGQREVRLPLPGGHQARNAALAAEILALLPLDLRPEWTALERGFAGVRWPGRLQREQIGGTTWLFDVAHNPAGVAALAAALPSLDLPPPVVLLVGILSDKAWTEMLPPLLAQVQGAVLTVAPTAPENRRWDPAEVAEHLNPPPGVAIRVILDFDAALGRASTLAPHGTVLVTGSVHTVGDAMARLRVSTT